jgi:oligopeptide transport system substrate-binding protein
MRSKIFALIGLLAIGSMALAACQPAPVAEPETIVVTQIVEVEGETVIQEVEVTVIPEPVEEEAAPMGPKTLVTQFGYGDIPTLDPALATDSSSIQVLEMTSPGLTRIHEETTATEPSLATSWDISDDGLVYTFHLRTDIPWVKYSDQGVVEVLDEEGNVRYVNANDFVYGIKRTLDPATASDYSYVLYIIEGAVDYNTGEVDNADGVGVEAIDDATLQITFTEAAAFNATIAGMWVANPMPQWVIEEKGDRWQETGFNQSYGPYALKEWVHDSYATVTVNPFWPADIASIPQPMIEEITWYFLDAVPAFAEYEAGRMDVTNVPLADLDRVKADPVLSEQLFIGPSFCTYYYGFDTTGLHTDDVRIRRALSLAVDRQSLVDNVTKGGQIPAQWFSRPGLAGSPTTDSHPDLGVVDNVEEAKKLLQEYLDEKGLTAEELDIAIMFNTSSGHQAIAEAIQAMWNENLGLEVKVTNQEWKVYLKTVRSENTPQVWRMGWCMDYPDANNFIYEVMTAGGSANSTPVGGINWKDGEDYDAWFDLLSQAKVEADPVKRVELYAQAEQILVWEKAAIIPLYWYTTVSVTQPWVDRTFSVMSAQHYEKWDIDMSAK